LVTGVSHSPKYSIVIPAYNESARLPARLASVFSCIRAHGWDAEVIVVNDGSTDATAELVRKLAEEAPELRLIENPGNRGKGYSVRSGMLQARGQVLLFTDSDSSVSIEDAENLFSAIAGGAQVAIGSRWLDTALQLRRQPLYRRFFGRCYNLVTRTVMGLPYADTQCGFKAFTSAAARIVFPLQTIERWGFDPEILYIARRFGFRIQEVPVHWSHDDRTRMSYFRDGFRMLKEIAIIRWNVLRGRYKRPLDQTEDGAAAS